MRTAPPPAAAAITPMFSSASPMIDSMVSGVTAGGEGTGVCTAGGDGVGGSGTVLVGASWMAVTTMERSCVVRKIEALDGVASCVVRVVVAATAALTLGTTIEKESSTKELWRARARRHVAVTVSVTAADGTLTSLATLEMMAARTVGV